MKNFFLENFKKKHHERKENLKRPKMQSSDSDFDENSEESTSGLSEEEEEVEDKFEKGVYGTTQTVNFVLYDSTNLYCVRPSGCQPTWGQCAGPTCFPRCCPCYNKHFRMCLPGIINKPKNICITASAMQKRQGKPFVNNVKIRIKKKEKPVCEIKEEECVPQKSEKLEIPPPPPAPVKKSVDQGTQVPRCSAMSELSTQTMAKLSDLLKKKRSEKSLSTQTLEHVSEFLRRRSASIDKSTRTLPPMPIAAPACLKILTRGLFDTTCLGPKIKYSTECNTEPLCRCTEPYEEIGDIEDCSKCFEEIFCPCTAKEDVCLGSCGYFKNSSIPKCIPSCTYIKRKDD